MLNKDKSKPSTKSKNFYRALLFKDPKFWFIIMLMGLPTAKIFAQSAQKNVAPIVQNSGSDNRAAGRKAAYEEMPDDFKAALDKHQSKLDSLSEETMMDLLRKYLSHTLAGIQKGLDELSAKESNCRALAADALKSGDKETASKLLDAAEFYKFWRITMIQAFVAILWEKRPDLVPQYLSFLNTQMGMTLINNQLTLTA